MICRSHSEKGSQKPECAQNLVSKSFIAIRNVCQISLKLNRLFESYGKTKKLHAKVFELNMELILLFLPSITYIKCAHNK